MNSLFTEDKDSKVADLVSNPGFDTRPLLNHLGEDVTWRQVFRTDNEQLMKIPGYGEKTVNQIRKFLSDNFTFTFAEFLQD